MTDIYKGPPVEKEFFLKRKFGPSSTSAKPKPTRLPKEMPWVQKNSGEASWHLQKCMGFPMNFRFNLMVSYFGNGWRASICTT